jgi:hypothetical protein
MPRPFSSLHSRRWSPPLLLALRLNLEGADVAAIAVCGVVDLSEVVGSALAALVGVTDNNIPIGGFDTTLIPSRAQYGAMACNPEHRKWLRNAGFASPCKPLQHPIYHS